MTRKAKEVDLHAFKLTKKEHKERKSNEEFLRPNSDNIKPSLKLEGKEAKAEWKRAVEFLTSKNLMSNVDCTALAIGCNMLQKYVNAEKSIKEKGAVYTSVNKFGEEKLYKNPYASLQLEYSKMYLKFCYEFGLTPSTRLSMSTKNLEQFKEKEESPFQTLLKLKNGIN